jgi:hypothetical protein
MTLFRLFNVLRVAPIAVAATVAAGPGVAQVINQDLIVQGSACVGTDCSPTQIFNSDTAILSENVLRMLFNDTSTLPGFPHTNWRFIFNDQFQNGADYFSVDDVSHGSNILRLDAGARPDSIHVSPLGKVGFGSANPQLILQATSGDSPGLRLEQDNSNGYGPQTWDIVGNEANFSVRDVTSGSHLPFRIRPGAPTSSIDISKTGRVGILTATPSAALHVLASAATINPGNGSAVVENQDGAANLQLLPASKNNQAFWNVGAIDANTFRLNASTNNPTVEFELHANGDLTIAGTLKTAGPTCRNGCDAVLGPDYPTPSIEEHALEMRTDGFLPNVGPTPAGAPIDVVDKLARVLNELEIAHLYIAELNQRITTLEAAVRDK